MTPAVSLDGHLSGPRKWESGDGASGCDGLEEKGQGEAGRRPGDACRGPRVQREDAKGGKGVEEVGRGGEKENEETGETNPGLSTLQTPPQGTWGTRSSARTFSSTSTSMPRCPG